MYQRKRRVMNGYKRFIVGATVLLLSGLAHVWGQSSSVVEAIKIKHVGPPAANEELIRANIRTEVGDKYSELSINDDVRNLYQTGYFYQIRVTEKQGKKGVILTYVLQGKPTLTDLRIEGNEQFSNKKLRKKIESEVGEPLDEQTLFQDVQAIQDFYEKKGYQRTEVEYVLDINEEEGRGTATFKISEHPKVRIKKVKFIGAEAFKQGKLRNKIKTRRHWFLSWLTGGGKLKEDQLQTDKERLRQFYQNKGYIDFRIKRVERDYQTPKKLVLKFHIFEGEQYEVGAIEIQGNGVFSDREIREALEMKVGEIFSPKGLSQDKENIRDLYGAEGYIDIGLQAVQNANTKQGTMDLVYKIEEKEKSYIEKINVQGNTKTKDYVIRRELAVSPGETFDMVRVKRSRNRLEGLNYFESVDTRPEETEVPNRKNLVVDVKEKNTGNISVGAGFSTVDNIVGFVEMSQGNFDLFNPPYFAGGGQKFRVRMQLGTRRQDYQVTFVEPWLLGKKLEFSVDLYHRQLDFVSNEYDERRTGGSLSLTKALWTEQFRGSVSYTLEEVDLEFEEDSGFSQSLIDAEEGSRLVSKMGFGLTYDTRGGGFLPSNGQRTELSTEVAGGPFGGDSDFYKVELSSAWYFPGFFEGHVWEILGRSGVTESYGRSDRVPLFDRFFLGGAYNLRGFDFREVGPRDPGNNEPIGGNTFWFGSVEYSIPVIERLRVATFYDIGNVVPDAYDPDFGGYSDNVGLGLRLNLPIGPLRLDYGIPITDGDGLGRSSGEFQFSVGYTRNF